MVTGAPVNVKDYGAIGNGTTDDTVAIQAALNYANSIDGAEVNLPRGTYICSSPLLIYKNTTFVGEGRTNTTLSFSNTGDGIQSTWPINSSTAVNIVVRDMNIVTTNVSNIGGGFADVGGTFIELTNVRFRGWKYNVILDQSEIVRIANCDFEPWITAGIWIVNGADHTIGANSGFTNQISVTGCQFNTAIGAGYGYAIADDGGANHYFAYNNFNGGNFQIWACSVAGLSIVNNEMEAGTHFGGPIQLSNTKINGSVLYPVIGFGIRDNTLAWGSYNIYLWACNDGQITGNTLYQYTTAAIDYDFSVIGRVSGVTIQSNSKAVIGNGRTNFPFFASTRLQFFLKQGVVNQFEEYYVTAALTSTGSQTITLPYLDGIAPSAVLLCTNADGTASEQVRVTAISGSTFTATFASTKTSNWTIHVLSAGWLPVMKGASTNTPASWTYATQQASYQQIGNRVYFDASVAWSASGGTGQLQMTLPVASVNVTGKSPTCAVALTGSVGIFTGYPAAQVSKSEAIVTFASVNPATGTPLAITSYADGAAYVSGSYEV